MSSTTKKASPKSSNDPRVVSLETYLELTEYSNIDPALAQFVKDLAEKGFGNIKVFYETGPRTHIGATGVKRKRDAKEVEVDPYYIMFTKDLWTEHSKDYSLKVASGSSRHSFRKAFLHCEDGLKKNVPEVAGIVDEMFEKVKNAPKLDEQVE